jgi:hypothetical protein
MAFGSIGKLLLSKLTGETNVSARRLPKGHDIEVVGESFRQDALKKASQGDTGVLNAIIFREPENEFDRNAVKVGIVIGGVFEHAGYLPRDAAEVFNPVMRDFEAAGFRMLACEARLVGGERSKSLGVWLNIASKRQVKAYLAAAIENPEADPDKFDDDESSTRYQTESDWDIPGWKKSIY